MFSFVRSFVCPFLLPFVLKYVSNCEYFLFCFVSSSQGPPHKLAVIFVDNSGVDIILGMFPFIRELLSRGTKV